MVAVSTDHVRAGKVRQILAAAGATGLSDSVHKRHQAEPIETPA
jgi:hypothetical protein